LGRSATEKNLEPRIKQLKKKVYKTMVKPVPGYRSETWAVTEMDTKRLGACERKILRRIHGPVVGKGKRNVENKNCQELRELLYAKI
jgi:hypothetical protein